MKILLKYSIKEFTYLLLEPAAMISRVVPKTGSRLGVGISACVHRPSSLSKAVSVFRDLIVSCCGVGHHCLQNCLRRLCRINITGIYTLLDYYD